LGANTQVPLALGTYRHKLLNLNSRVLEEAGVASTQVEHLSNNHKPNNRVAEYKEIYKMKEEIINRLQIVGRKIRRIIKSVERGGNAEEIITQTRKAKKMLLAVRHMILKNHLIKVAEQNGFSKNEILKNFDLMS